MSRYRTAGDVAEATLREGQTCLAHVGRGRGDHADLNEATDIERGANGVLPTA